MNATNRTNPEEIKACIESVPDRLESDRSNSQWTRAIKSVFIQLGKKYDWTICATSKEADESEWLFDLTWYSRPGDEGIEIGLILESEWSRYYEDLRFDFEKLIVARSPFKVFIFEAQGQYMDECFDRFSSAIDKCWHASEGETYIFACYNTPIGKFEFRKKTGSKKPMVTF